MREITLEERKALQLDILVKIDAICRDKGFRYYLSSGTLLGAVRHQGYIPWDDDIDLTMPRPDYEAFYSYFTANNNDADLQLISYRDKTSIYPFCKMVNPKTTVVEHYVDPQYQTGVWVDIFPLDGVRSNDDTPFDLNAKTKARYNVTIANPDYATSSFRKLIKHVLVPMYRKQTFMLSLKNSMTLCVLLPSAPKTMSPL